MTGACGKSKLDAAPLVGFGLACMGALIAAWGLVDQGSPAFVRYFGAADPRAVVLVSSLAGLVAIASLNRHGWIGAGASLHQVVAIGALAVGFALPTVLVDIVQPFPETINVPAPRSLVFYPAIAVVVEVLFHLVPLAIVLAAWHLFQPAVNGSRFWIAALPVSALEPAFQLLAGLDSGIGWRDLYLVGHLFTFSLLQLGILRRHGFLPMLGFRLVYYLVWHILWGQARLVLLFQA